MSEPFQLPPLTPELYDELRELAGRIYRERGFGHHTVQPTVLLHEAWEKLSASRSHLASLEHFKATCAMAMRQILVDRARRKSAAKRGADPVRTTLAGLAGSDGDTLVGLLDLDEALNELEGLDPRAAKIVELRIFGGLTAKEISGVTGIPVRTVERVWRFARAFLADRMRGEGGV